MHYDPTRPLIVQSDRTILLEVQHPRFEEIRNCLGKFADLIKSPDPIHTYRITPLSLWNAAAVGTSADEINRFLAENGKFELPQAVAADVRTYIGTYGTLRLEPCPEGLCLISEQTGLLSNLLAERALRGLEIKQQSDTQALVLPEHRGLIKQEMTRIGYPVLDLVGYHQGEALPIRLREHTRYHGTPLTLRQYQSAAVESFYREGSVHGGSGVLVLPCGAGKTIIGIAAMARTGCATLILTTNVTSVRQWKRELLDKTDISEEMIGEYNGMVKQVRPITIATYHILTYRRAKEQQFHHMNLFNERDWGLIIYDEVHLLPAPVFRATADIQATRRLGLTATLVREDGREEDVFSLVGPKRFEAPWKELEKQGWIASVSCTEVRVPMTDRLREQYSAADSRAKHRIAGENPLKIQAIERLLSNHSDEQTLIIGQYLDQLSEVSRHFRAPLISGSMPHDERERLYESYKRGEIRVLVVSKVANFAVDLPEASVAIQISGSFGSRQEEAQRIGRIIRPKRSTPGNRAFFYTLVSRDSKEQEFAAKRQLFLIEQGYNYRIADGDQPAKEQVPS